MSTVHMHLWLFLLLQIILSLTISVSGAIAPGLDCPGTPADSCVDNAVCDGTTSTCECNDNFYNTTDNCLPKIALGDNCTAFPADQCVDNAACTGDGDTCACDSNFYNGSGACLQKKAPGAGCSPSTADQCVDNAACTGAGNTTCACDSDFYDNASGACLQKVFAGGTCTGTSSPIPCVDNATCDGSTCQCDSGYYNNGSHCVLKVIAGGTCMGLPSPNPCVDNATCDGTMCQCNSSHYNNSGNCDPKKTYGDECGGNVECQTSNNQTCVTAKDNTNRCLCLSGFFWSRGSSPVCKPESDLAVQNITMNGNHQEMSISVTWNAPAVQGGVTNIYSEYRAALTNPTTVSPWSDTLSYTFNSLTPGTTYNVTISTRTLRNDAYYSNENATFETNGVDFFTKPAQPGNLTASEFPGPDVPLQFASSAGHVDQYRATITGLSNSTIDAPAASGTQSVSFPGLTLGQYYNVTLVAIINPDSQPIVSVENTRQFRVQANASGVVKNFTLWSVESRTMTASWRKPTDPNGAMTGYNLRALRVSNQTCASAVVFHCIDCTPSRINQQNTRITGCNKVVTVNTTASDLTNASHQFQASLTGLLPDVLYTVNVLPYNEAGKGLVTSMNGTTLEEVAVGLQSLTVETGSQKGELVVSWTPGLRTGTTNYTVSWAEQYSLSSNVYNMTSSAIVQGYNTTSHTISGLLSYWNYKVTVQAVTTLGSGPASYHTSRTRSSAPGMPSISLEQPDDTATELKLRISCPAEKNRNGIITKFIYNSFTIAEGAGPSGTASVTDCSVINQAVDVVAEKTYNFTVYAMNSANEEGEKIYQTQYIQPRVPKLDNRPEGVPFLMKPVPADIKETSVEVDVCRCVVRPDQGAIVMAGITVCVKSASEYCTSGFDAGGTEPWKTLDTWKRFKDRGYKGKYRPTDDNWKYFVETKNVVSPPPGTRRRRAVPNYSERVTYTIGADPCPGPSDSVYCNGPLPDSTSIVIFVWSCTSAGCSQTESVVAVTSTPDEIPIGAIVGGVIAAVVVIAVIAAVIVFVMYRRRRGPPGPHRGGQGGSRMHPPVRRPIKLKDIASHLDRLHKDSNHLFQEEFEDVEERSPVHYSQETSTLDINKIKNRYVNILPFEHTRVKLTADDDGDSSDFVNANYIPGYTSPREYIATQGPMTSMVADFWRMMWEQKSSLIVMLSDLQEKGRPKVDQYWPGELHSPVQYGNIVVELTSDSTLNKYTIRTFTISQENKPDDTRHVQQYFNPGWEDYSANLRSDDMLDFIAAVRQAARSGHVAGNAADHGPVCVHCSAGVGRTGTFIALDFLMQFVKEHSLDDEVDIYNLVLNMRHNRKYMVQSEKQYIFIHDTLKLIIEKKVKEMQRDDNNIYQNSDPKDNVYANQAYEPEELNLHENRQSTTVV